MPRDQRPRAARDTETPGEEREHSFPHGVGPGNRTTKRFDQGEDQVAKDHAPVAVRGLREEAPDAPEDPQAAFDASVRAAEDAIAPPPQPEVKAPAKDPCPRCGAELERTRTVGGWSGLPVEGVKCSSAECGYVGEPRYLEDTAKISGGA